MADDDDGPIGDEIVVEEAESKETILARISSKQQEVEKLLSMQRVSEALAAALTDPPVNTREEACKTANWMVVQKAIMAVKDVDAAVRELPDQHSDTLMKYLYRGLETGERGMCDQCLKLHEKLTNKAGMGCIIRAISDRRQTV